MDKRLAELRRLRIALVHYWLLRMRGGEKVLEALCELFPTADLYTLFFEPDHISKTIRRHRVHTSFLQKIPGARRHHRMFLPFFPLAIEQFDLTSYDLVISSESGIAKGIIVPPQTCHVCYCHSPMRYLWNMYHFYRDYRQSRWRRGLFAVLSHYVRLWDFASAARVDHFVANSRNVAARIEKYYRRPATVIPPPVDTEDLAISETVEDFYLVVSELVAYKRIDIAIEAFNELGKPLIVIGDGPERTHLQRRARSHIRFLGSQPRSVLARSYARTQALIVPGEEDAGIVALEAQASGRPVIAYGRGGLLETVIPGETGLFFYEQSKEAVIEAVQEYERQRNQFQPGKIRAHARRFDRETFKKRMITFLWEIVTRQRENQAAIGIARSSATCASAELPPGNRSPWSM